MRSEAVETVVIGLNWVGDNILAFPTYRALHHRFRAEGGIAVAVPANVATLMAASGLFRKVVAWDGSSIPQRVRRLRAEGFRRAVILPNSFKSALVTFGAGIRERWGYSTDYRALLLTNHIHREPQVGHQLDDYSALLAALSAPRVVDEIPSLVLPSSVRDHARRQLRSLGINFDRPLYGIHPGGLYGRAKHWGDERYGEVASRLRADGCDVVLLTSPAEHVQAQTIAAACDGIPVIGHDGDVLHLAAAISHCSLVITNDSGPLHLATALAVPSVSIFGPTDPGRTVIPGATRVLRRSLGCSPCYRRECPFGHHQCMTEIATDEVFDAAVGLYAEIEGRLEERHIRG